MAKYFASSTNEISSREQEHMEEVRSFAAECMLLLENDGTLPLAGTRKIALFGNGARHTVKGGTGSGDVNSRKVFTIEEGLADAGFSITTGDWLDRYDRIREEAQEAYHQKVAEIAAEKGIPPFGVYFEYAFPEPEHPAVTREDMEASDTDTAVYVISRNSGEGADRYVKRGDYLLLESERDNLTLLGGYYKKVIVVLNVANVIDTTELNSISGIGAVLLAGQSGNVGGLVVADVLTGKSVPCGKLTDTWAASYEDYASSENFSHDNGNLDDEYYTDGIYVGYRYFDTFGITPNYCFGYGKSYTDFSVETLDVTGDEEKISIKVRVVNTGSFRGKEVVQIYYSAPGGSLEKPYQELAAFGKTDFLDPGQAQEMTISFPVRSMASYSQEKAAWILEKGTYYIRVGNSSRNTHVEAAVTLAQDTVTAQLKNLFSDTEQVQEISGREAVCLTYPREEEEKAYARVIVLDGSKITAETVEYREKAGTFPKGETAGKLTMEDVRAGRATLEELVSQLTPREMAELCNGTARGGVGSESMIGAASAAVPGAAGDTTSLLLEDRGVANIILADGPAGLRLYPHFAVDAQGNLLPGYEVFGDVRYSEKPGEIPEGGAEYYQYCTAIPVASLLAQSWDMDLIARAGDIVGKEMEEFHVTLWLAPGMNIHRNPLCGRNFEYYSEDPLLAGMCAAADTDGVQSHAGIGTTIKHFAANNQEDNRMHTNAHISERALREIYLKGFEIAVKTAQPMSIMTSYNLLNGTHTANHYDLLTWVARDEWGFQGVVMTDWGTTDDMSMMFGMERKKYGESSAVECIRTGNDLIMPGSQKSVDEITAAAEDGSLDLDALRLCACRVLKIIGDSQAYEGSRPYAEQFGVLDWAVEVEK